MKNKLKNIFYYLLEFLMVICVVLTTILLVIKITVLNSDYLIKKLEDNNYYSDLYQIIEVDMEDYLLPSGFDKIILNDLFTEDVLKDEVNNVVKSLYNGKKIKVSTDIVADKLKENINSYLADNNLKISDEKVLNRFTDEVLKIYVQRIKLTDYINNGTKMIVKICKLVNILLISMLAVTIMLALIIKLAMKKRLSTIPLITSSFLLFIANYFLFEKINIKEILFWNDSVSLVIQNVFYDLSNYLKIIAIIFLGIGIFTLIFTAFMSRKKK